MLWNSPASLNFSIPQTYFCVFPHIYIVHTIHNYTLFKIEEFEAKTVYASSRGKIFIYSIDNSNLIPLIAYERVSSGVPKIQPNNSQDISKTH